MAKYEHKLVCEEIAKGLDSHAIIDTDGSIRFNYHGLYGSIWCDEESVKLVWVGLQPNKKTPNMLDMDGKMFELQDPSCFEQIIFFYYELKAKAKECQKILYQRSIESIS